MKKLALIGTLIAATLLQTATPAYADDGGEIAAGIIGGIIGGVIGNEIGHDHNPPPRYPGPGHRPGRPGRPGYPPHYPPGRPGPGYPPGRPLPPPPPAGQYTGSVQINQVTRQPGGRWYRISLWQPMSLSAIEVRVLRPNVSLHEAYLVTDYNQRLPIFELTNTPVLGQNASAVSYINRNDRVAAIDIRAESFGAFADILVNVTSYEGYPQLNVTPY